MVINVHDFHAAGDGLSDDTTAFTDALNELDVHGGGTLLVPPGTYLVGDLRIGSGIFIRGTGPPQPVLSKRQNAASILRIVSELAAGGSLLHDISIDGITLRGRSVEDGFSEHVHNLLVGGVARLSVRHTTFEAFQGDGLYLGSRLNSFDPVAHNSDVNIADNSFDGVNAENRNGISVIDCSRCVVDENIFSRTTRPDMPGAIDLEPNQRDELIRDVVVGDNIITQTGSGAILLQLRFKDFLRSPGHVLIEGNRIQNAQVGIQLLWSGTATPGIQSLDALVWRNVVSNVDHPMVLDGVAGTTVAHNVFSLSGMDLTLGCRFGAFDVHFTGNIFATIGSMAGHGITLCGPLAVLNFSGNTFVDVGSSAGTRSAVHFASGSTFDIAFIGNAFSSPSGQTLFAITTASSVSFAPGTNTWRENILNDGIRLGEFPHGNGFSTKCR